MNVLNLLTKERNVAGIEISDEVVRIAFFRDRGGKRARKATGTPNDNGNRELVLIEEPIPANVIEGGVVIDKALFGKTLKNILAKAHIGTGYAIVAIPDDKIYSRVFSFPKTIEGSRLTEAMNLAIGFQLPVRTETVYLDWERAVGTPLVNEILFSTVPRAVAHAYVEALEDAGIKTLALESNLGSIARAIKVAPGVTTLFVKKTPDGATIFALKDGLLRFSRTLPRPFVAEVNIPAEVAKIKSALESETKDTVPVVDFLDATFCDEYARYEAISPPKPKWLVAIGALIRGQKPMGSDNLISLLPVGTEEAYAYQKASTFATLIRNMTIGVSVFFVCAFLATYLLILSLAQNAERTVATLETSSLSPELIQEESRIGRVNALTEAGATILAGTPLWSTVIDEINARIIEGVIVSNFAAPSITEKFSLGGIARDRATLNNFKRSLQEATLLSEVEIPLTNLEQKENIPFSASFRIKDPGTVYYK